MTTEHGFKDSLKTVREMAEKYAKDNGYELNSEFKTLAKLYIALAKNMVKYGEPYCPCRVNLPGVLNPKNVCPCAYNREEIEKNGHCRCRLFYIGENSTDKRSI